MRSIDYQTFTEQFQELKLFSGKREPLNGRELKLFIKTMRKIVDLYKKIMGEIGALSDFPLWYHLKNKKARLTAGSFYHSFFENIILFFQQ